MRIPPSKDDMKVQWHTLLKFNDLANLHQKLVHENEDTRSAFEKLNDSDTQSRELQEQEQLKKVATHDELAEDFKLKHNIPSKEIERLERINKAFDVVLAEKTVPEKQLKPCLTAEEWQRYEEYRTRPVQTDNLRLTGERPEELASYIEKLNKADFVWHQYENRRNLKNPAALESKAESLYEDAALRLQEILEATDASERARIEMWLDRSVSFDDANKEDNITLGAHSMPRVIGTQSKYANAGSALPKASSRIQTKVAAIEVLLEAAVAIGFDTQHWRKDAAVEFAEVNGEKLKQMLAGLKETR